MAGKTETSHDASETISAIAAAALIVVATTMLPPRSPSIVLSAAAMPPQQELHTMVGVSAPCSGSRRSIAGLSDGTETLKEIIVRFYWRPQLPDRPGVPLRDRYSAVRAPALR